MTAPSTNPASSTGPGHYPNTLCDCHTPQGIRQSNDELHGRIRELKAELEESRRSASRWYEQAVDNGSRAEKAEKAFAECIKVKASTLEWWKEKMALTEERDALKAEFERVRNGEVFTAKQFRALEDAGWFPPWSGGRQGKADTPGKPERGIAPPPATAKPAAPCPNCANYPNGVKCSVCGDSGPRDRDHPELSKNSAAACLICGFEGKHDSHRIIPVSAPPDSPKEASS